MPLFYTGNIPKTNLTLGIWHLTETSDREFRKMLSEESLIEAHDAYPGGPRLLERLAVLLLLDKLLGDHGSLSHTESGSPFLDGDYRPVSISHTRHWVAVVVSDEPDTHFGVDIQAASPKTLSVLDRICTRSEVEPFGKEHLREASLLLFSAKEAAYKYLDTPGAAYYLERLRASLGAYGTKGELRMDYLDESGKEVLRQMRVLYAFFEDCVLTLAM